MKLDNKRVALFGGSFDPPHVAHLMVANYALAVADIDIVLAVPTFDHALDKSFAASFENRLSMLKTAFAHDSRVMVSAIESELPSPSRTLNTIHALKERHPGIELRLVIGTDILAETHRWHRWDEVVELAPLILLMREGHPQTFGHESLPVPLPRVSSTQVRARLRRGASVDGLVPSQLVRDFDLFSLYADQPTP